MLYTRLDEARLSAERALRAVHRSGGDVASVQGLVEREVAAGELAGRVSHLHAVERGLCFGRIDTSDATTTYVGRIGLRDAGHESVLIDWRAPAARAFYTATPSAPGELVRRRHLHTREREVVGLDDEVFDLDGMAESVRRTLVGEAALLATLRRGRTGRMADVVATIQSEQDRVIRAGLQGALVVQGGPGTGKTVAALHRAAYLLYTHRDTLDRRGVLVIGPNAMFLRYIGQVLPALGETQVVMATLGELFPGVRATAADTPAAAVVKGDLRMAGAVAAAVRERQRVPDGDLLVEVDGLALRVPHDTCAALRDRARAVRLPHNMARKLFVTELLKELARAEARALEAGLRLAEVGDPEYDVPLDLEDDLDELDLTLISERLWAEPPVRRAVDALWPELTPRRLVGDLLSSRDLLAAVVPPELDGGALLRAPGSPWTVGDVPLLDEAAELLGEDDSAARSAARRADREWAEEELYAEEVAEITGLAEFGEEMGLAGRHHDDGQATSLASRAAADRTWAYGHVIVDEAQELSEMAWRAVMRRVPARSLTVVGDVAQTGSAAGARSWGGMLDHYLEGRWREERLLVNYRTPVEIMRVAAAVLAEIDPDQVPPESVRDGGARPRAVLGGMAALPALVAEELAEVGEGAVGEGRLGVVVSDALHERAAALFPRSDDLGEPVVVLTVTQAKGLEFDAVVVVDPAGMPPRDLYVAVTRATRRLAVLHEGELPASLKSTL
ncbi:ATP-binding domain-containing protein [Nonomuraea sp. NBC_01738]|uniref:HelD family protein n=1 Tax=Nonomuraea sp. NBC_01738 TaxID=2976003 RepID=UPI002E12253E|nr:ATP-binding domain-containing protein [Nonomuraea sp. NBC_01738]